MRLIRRPRWMARLVRAIKWEGLKLLEDLTFRTRSP